LIWGSKYLGATYEVLGISILNKERDAAMAVTENIEAVSDFLGIPARLKPNDVQVNDSYIGEGYGIPTKEGIEAIRLVAQTEGLFLDPVYTGKAMAGLIDLIRKGKFRPNDTVVFIHTGGIPALFAYHEEMRGKK
jgi:1-aminocyclopropane-1-carboxylate deaminase/D-cysteine desulfhydrase-like pyridoxal-dependent ACC family enzyme